LKKAQPDEDTKDQLLLDFQKDSPVHYARVNTAVNAMPDELFHVVISPIIQQKNFSFAAATANPPKVLIIKLPTCLQDMNKRSSRNSPNVQETPQQLRGNGDTFRGDYPDIGTFYPAVWEYRQDMPQVHMCGMTIADDTYDNGQSEMYRNFRMKAAICANDPKIVSSISIQQMGNTVINNL
jgi:hypothetical protein